MDELGKNNYHVNKIRPREKNLTKQEKKQHFAHTLRVWSSK